MKLAMKVFLFPTGAKRTLSWLFIKANGKLTGEI